MKVNQEGQYLIDLFINEYDPAESRTSAQKAVKLYVKRKLNSNQFSALVCLVMNISIEEFRKSKLLRYINASEHSAEMLGKAMDEWSSHYIYEDSGYNFHILDPFLLHQRQFETALFLKLEEVKKRKAR